MYTTKTRCVGKRSTLTFHFNFTHFLFLTRLWNLEHLVNTLTLWVFDVAALLNLNPMRHCIDGASHCWTDGVQLNTPHLCVIQVLELPFKEKTTRNYWFPVALKRVTCPSNEITEHVHSTYHYRKGIPGYWKQGSQLCISWRVLVFLPFDSFLPMVFFPSVRYSLIGLIGHIRLADEVVGPQVHSRGQDYKALTLLESASFFCIKGHLLSWSSWGEE